MVYGRYDIVVFVDVLCELLKFGVVGKVLYDGVFVCEIDCIEICWIDLIGVCCCC